MKPSPTLAVGCGILAMVAGAYESGYAAIAWFAAGLAMLTFASWGWMKASAARSRQLEIEQKALDDAALNAAQEEFNRFMVGEPPSLNESVHGVILQAGETCWAISEHAQHITTINKTSFVGASQGVSIRLARGVSYRVGGFKGHPVVETSEVVADTGTVFVTAKRVIFAGSKEVSTVDTKKIADVRVDRNRVIVLVANRTKPLVVGITERYRAPVIAAAAHKAASAIAAPAGIR